MNTVHTASVYRVTFALCFGFAASACGSAVRTVPSGPQGASAPPPVVVDTPPPPAKAEWIPKDPGSPCAWLDGHWNWVDETWQWSQGAWVVPPADCYFAPPEAVWVPNTGKGLLFYLAGRWYPASGTKACEAPRACGSLRPLPP
jgi:hypothetical protein